MDLSTKTTTREQTETETVIYDDIKIQNQKIINATVKQERQILILQVAHKL
jgi:hypothetical protein